MRDRDVRSAVLQRLSADHAGDDDTRVVEEMAIWSGTVRIDVAVINGELAGYELKSERDTLERLPAQMAIYSRVFDRVTLVVGERHYKHAELIVPHWWGLTAALPGGDHVALVDIREAAINPTPDSLLVSQLLWRDEALAVLNKTVGGKGLRSKRVKILHQMLADSLSHHQLSNFVRDALKQRADWLRKQPTNQLDVPIDGYLNPVF